MTTVCIFVMVFRIYFAKFVSFKSSFLSRSVVQCDDSGRLSVDQPFCVNQHFPHFSLESINTNRRQQHKTGRLLHMMLSTSGMYYPNSPANCDGATVSSNARKNNGRSIVLRSYIKDFSKLAMSPLIREQVIHMI